MFGVAAVRSQRYLLLLLRFHLQVPSRGLFDRTLNHLSGWQSGASTTTVEICAAPKAKATLCPCFRLHIQPIDSNRGRAEKCNGLRLLRRCHRDTLDFRIDTLSAQSLGDQFHRRQIVRATVEVEHLHLHAFTSSFAWAIASSTGQQSSWPPHPARLFVEEACALSNSRCSVLRWSSLARTAASFCSIRLRTWVQGSTCSF